MGDYEIPDSPNEWPELPPQETPYVPQSPEPILPDTPEPEPVDPIEPSPKFGANPVNWRSLTAFGMT